jgi:cell division septation protein DedD
MSLHDDTDDGFREVQLSGKQLVFLFMATTVVAIGIFLSGVFVGKGVRVEAPEGVQAAAAADSAAEPSTVAPEPVGDAPDAVTDAGAPTELPKELTYQRSLADEPESRSRPAARSASSASAASPAPAAPTEPANAEAPRAETPKAETPKAETPSPAKTDSSGTPASAAAPSPAAGAYSVQVAALADRGEADQLLKRLQADGYPAFVVLPPSGSGSVLYKVRVGQFSDRADAQEMLQRLQRGGQFKPWITR